MEKGIREKIDCQEIIDGFLYLGSAKASKNLEGMKRLKITHIVNVAGKQHFPHDFTYHLCHFEDSTTSEILSVLPSIFEFIDNAKKEKGRVLIHCSGGVSRSASVTIGYLMKSANLNLREAYIHTKQRRSGVKPNVGLQQLLKLESELFGKNSLTEVEINNISKAVKV